VIHSYVIYIYALHLWSSSSSFYAVKLYTLYITIINVTLHYSNGLILINTHTNVQQTRNITKAYTILYIKVPLTSSVAAALEVVSPVSLYPVYSSGLQEYLSVRPVLSPPAALAEHLTAPCDWMTHSASGGCRANININMF